MFADVKRRLKFYRHRNYLETVNKVQAIMLSYNKKKIEGFFKHTLKNMVGILQVVTYSFKIYFWNDGFRLDNRIIGNIEINNHH